MTPALKDVIKEVFFSKFMIIVYIGAAVIMAYASLLILPKDNPIEQSVEKIIKQQTGIKVDLTPEGKNNGRMD